MNMKCVETKRKELWLSLTFKMDMLTFIVQSTIDVYIVYKII